MKKIVLLVVALFSMTMSYAENENNNAVQEVQKYDMTTVNMRKLAVTLGLTKDQYEVVSDIHRNFCSEMMVAAYADGESREAMMEKAVEKDVRYMHYVLDHKQYNSYLKLLNTTLVNRGLK